MFNSKKGIKSVTIEQEVTTAITVDVQARVRDGVVHCQAPTKTGSYHKFDLPAAFVPAFTKVFESVGPGAKSLAGTNTDYLTIRITLEAIEPKETEDAWLECDEES